jgi:hypothetical protein
MWTLNKRVHSRLTMEPPILNLGPVFGCAQTATR